MAVYRRGHGCGPLHFAPTVQNCHLLYPSSSRAVKCTLSYDMNSIDPLTGFLDRFGCLQMAVRLAADSMAGGKAFAVVWINLDRFKQINDRLATWAATR